MDGFVAAVVVAVGVDLQVQREAFHALLRGEVCAQAVDGNEDLWRDRGIPSNGEGLFTAKCFSEFSP